MAREYGEGRGAQLAIGDHDPRPDTVQPDRRFRLVDLAPARGGCHGQAPDALGESAAKGLGRSGAEAIFANIHGDRPFVQAVFRGLEARNVRLAR